MGRHSVGATLPCINGLSARFELAVVYTPDAAEEGYTDGALNDDVALANARLIAAAPELLRALENLANAASATSGFASPMFLKDARAAIAKARGAA